MGYSFSFNSNLLIHITLQSHVAALRQGFSAGGDRAAHSSFFSFRIGKVPHRAWLPSLNHLLFPFPSPRIKTSPPKPDTEHVPYQALLRGWGRGGWEGIGHRAEDDNSPSHPHRILSLSTLIIQSSQGFGKVEIIFN